MPTDLANRQELIESPRWRAEDLGEPIPPSPHAVSVCLPTWRDNVGYEEGEPRVHETLTTGYPRFVYNRLCRDLFDACEDRFARDGEACLAFVSESAAERFRRYLHDQVGCSGRIHPLGIHRVHAVSFPREHAAVARSGWQHCGEGITSRRAEACLKERSAEEATAAKDAIREHIGRLTGVSPGDVFLFPYGMTAIFAVYRVLCSLFPARKSVQFGFPYVDTLKIQEKFGPGVHFYPCGNTEELEQLGSLLESEAISGLFTEFPSNPLLVSPDLERLAELARRHAFPLILDDTLAGFLNADLFPAADVLCSSLTKFFSGVGDVTGGSVVLNPRSPFYPELASGMKREAEDLLWGADALVLERNSRDFAERMPQINANAETLADFLREHPKVEAVDYPKFRTPGHYRTFRRPGGGYGGLMSVLLRDASHTAAPFYDALRISKGPNLGTNYSLACPYTILAHYRELDFAEACGVSRWLIRVSVGLEEPDELIRRFEEALRRI